MPATSSIRSTRAACESGNTVWMNPSPRPSVCAIARTSVSFNLSPARAANAGAFGLSDMMVRTALPSSALRRNSAPSSNRSLLGGEGCGMVASSRAAYWSASASCCRVPVIFSPTRFEHAQNRSASRPAGRADAARSLSANSSPARRAPFHAQSGTRRPIEQFDGAAAPVAHPGDRIRGVGASTGSASGSNG